MTIKVNYDTETTLVKGYYPDSIDYVSIPEPYVGISEQEHQQALGKQMCVVNGVFQEYIAPLNIQLQEAKNKKISEIKALRDSNLTKPTPQTISYEGNLANKTFALTRDDLTLINVIIGDLEEKIANGLENPTRDWTAIEGRFALNVGDFKSLRTHMIWRDELEYTQARLKIEEIKALTTLEEIESYDINKIIS